MVGPSMTPIQPVASGAGLEFPSVSASAEDGLRSGLNPVALRMQLLREAAGQSKLNRAEVLANIPPRVAKILQVDSLNTVTDESKAQKGTSGPGGKGSPKSVTVGPEEKQSAGIAPERETTPEGGDRLRLEKWPKGGSEAEEAPSMMAALRNSERASNSQQTLSSETEQRIEVGGRLKENAAQGGAATPLPGSSVADNQVQPERVLNLTAFRDRDFQGALAARIRGLHSSRGPSEGGTAPRNVNQTINLSQKEQLELAEPVKTINLGRNQTVQEELVTA